MAAAEGARRFITRADVEDAARAGRPVQLGPRDVITDEAAECARGRGVRVERATVAHAPMASRPAQPATRRADADGLRAAVRAAVVAELGHEPAGLDAALDKVLASRPT
jgi:hypothetical protein